MQRSKSQRDDESSCEIAVSVVVEAIKKIPIERRLFISHFSQK